MSQRVHNLSKWILLEEGRSLGFAKPKRRTVILDVNCPGEVAFYVLHVADDVRRNPEDVADFAAGRVRRQFAASEVGVPRQSDDREEPLSFLGVAKGRQRFEFGVEGGFSLIAEGGPCYVYSADGLQTESRVVAPVVFTRIANRRARSPELELMQYRMRLNEEARMRALEREAERRVAALEERLERYMPERTGGTAIERPVKAERRESGEPSMGDDDAVSPAKRAEVAAAAVAATKASKKREAKAES